MKLICINCPRGCHLIVEEIADEVKVEGNFCPRGVAYATNELKNPLRTITTTLPIDSVKCERLPVMTSVPVPKDRVMDIMKSLKDVKTKAPVKLGEVIVENILNMGSDIIASKSIEK